MRLWSPSRTRLLLEYRRLRRMIALTCMPAVMALVCSVALAEQARRSATTFSAVLVVSDRDAAADAIVAKAQESGGYFLTRTNNELVLKVPVDRVDAIVELAGSLGALSERQHQTDDLGFTLDQDRARLASKQEMLERFRTVMKDSRADGVLSVEKEMTRLVGEIELLKGSIRLTEHRIRFAQVSITFRYRDRAAPVPDGTSSFPWLNTVNLGDLLEDFRREHD
jgi:hypothetical protein